jgi:peptide/nickel transport system substrate-binding protein
VWGRPYVEQIVVRRIEASLVGAAMESGEFDFIGFPSHLFMDFQNPTNFRFMGSPSATYSYVSFRLGTFDGATSRNVLDPGRPMNNIHLRRAMALAADEHLLGQTLFNGLQFTAGNFFVPRHEVFMDLSVPMFGHDPALANQILDDAGFVRGPDGYRRWPDGSDLTVTWAMAVGDTAEAIFLFYTEAWRDIGVRVELWRGAFHTAGYLFDVLDYDTDDWEIDIYSGAWTVGANPAPFGSWGHLRWNPSRYTSAQWDDFERRVNSENAWDLDYLNRLFSEMQWYMYETVFFFPQRWAIALTALNNRVSAWDTRMDLNPMNTQREFGWQNVRLTAPTPHAR